MNTAGHDRRLLAALPSCPSCGTIAQVSWVSTAYYAALEPADSADRLHRTRLAARLEPPDLPVWLSPSRYEVLGAALMIVGFPVYLMLVVPVLERLGWPPLGAVFGVPLAVMLVWAYGWRRIQRREREQARAALAALDRWERSVYCGRCDRLYLPYEAAGVAGEPNAGTER